MDDLIERYKADKHAVIAAKKSAIKYCDASSGVYMPKSTTNLIKSADTDSSAEKLIVANTYLWLDSHSDVHAKNSFADSIKNDPLPAHLHDHEFKILAQIGKVLEVREQKIAWRTLGVEKDGYTQSLMMKSEIMKDWNPTFYDMYKQGRIQQHSVGMRYEEIRLAYDTEEKYYKEEKELYDEYIEKIGNPEAAGKAFWVVDKASLIEVSAVLRGSNILTPTIKQNEIQDKSEEDLINLIKSNINFI